MATHSRILAWRIPMDRGAWRAAAPGVTKSQTGLKQRRRYKQKNSCLIFLCPGSSNGCISPDRKVDSPLLVSTQIAKALEF